MLLGEITGSFSCLTSWIFASVDWASTLASLKALGFEPSLLNICDNLLPRLFCKEDFSNFSKNVCSVSGGYKSLFIVNLGGDRNFMISEGSITSWELIVDLRASSPTMWLIELLPYTFDKSSVADVTSSSHFWIESWSTLKSNVVVVKFFALYDCFLDQGII